MLIIGIICLVMAAISYLRCLSIKNNNAKKIILKLMKLNGNVVWQLFS